MSSSKLIRWSGLAALLGGGLLVVVDVIDGVVFPGTPEGAAMASSAWVIFNVLNVLLITLASLGLVGIYVRQAEQAGALGLFSLLVLFLGIAMMSGALWSAAFIFPWMAEAAPALLDAEPSGVVIVGFLLTLVLFAWVVCYLASLRCEPACYRVAHPCS